MKNIRIFLSENFPFLVVKFSICLNRRVFVMFTYIVGIHWNHITEMISENTHNVCFHGEICKIFIWISVLSINAHVKYLSEYLCYL